MKIYDRNYGPIRPDRPADNREKEGVQKDRAPGILPVDNGRSDKVEISDAARKLAKDVISALPADAKDRLAQVRQRVLSGAYDIDQVVSEVAQRILKRGDV